MSTGPFELFQNMSKFAATLSTAIICCRGRKGPTDLSGVLILPCIGGHGKFQSTALKPICSHTWMEFSRMVENFKKFLVIVEVIFFPLVRSPHRFCSQSNLKNKAVKKKYFSVILINSVKSILDYILSTARASSRGTRSASSPTTPS